MDPFPEEIPWVCNLVVWAVMTAAVSQSYNLKYAEASCRYILSFSPSGPAFGMWFAIWTAVVASVGTQAVLYALDDERPFAPPEASALLSFAFAAASLWAPFFSDNSPGGYWCAAAALATCAALAVAASVVDSVYGPRTAVSFFLVHPAFALMAGWTCLACCLSVGIALRATAERSEGDAKVEAPCDNRSLYYDILTPNPDFPHDSTVVPLALSAVLCVVSVIVCDPLLLIPVAWGVYFMHPSWWNRIALLLLAISATVAAALS
tara:strand:- start:25381 stop:26172 length:792 start_codon:yes stop_codon:yes gene_type:complete